MNNKKQLIEEFRASKYGIQPDGTVSSNQSELREDLTNAVEQLSTGLYEKNVHFLMELIQNAEDNEYPEGVEPELKLVLLNDDPSSTPGSDGCLCVFNNEIGFNHENIKGISGVGKSTKRKQDGYIGEKGIGFKSVFIVCSSPHIFSNGYQICFFEKDKQFNLNYIVPYWVDTLPNVVLKENMTTSLLLPLKPGKKTEIIDYLKSIKPESLLFLKKLRQLSINILGESTIHIAVNELGRDVVELTACAQNQTKRSRYWLYNEMVQVPPHLKKGDQKEEKREGVAERDITLALPLDKSEIEGKVFAYLPTEVDSGLPFLINSDFLLTANRESLQSDRPWNQWLKNEMAGVILNALDKIHLQPEYRKTFYRYIPLKAGLKTLPEYFSPIINKVNTALSEKPLVLTTEGTLFQACNTRFPKKTARELFAGKSLPVWFQNTGFVDPELTRFDKQIREIGGKELGKKEFPLILDDKEWLDEQSEGWLTCLWKYLSEEKYKKEALADKYILPTSQGIRRRAKDLVFYAYNSELIASIPEVTKELVNFLSESFESNSLFKYLESEGFIRHFSLDNFIAGTLLPYVERVISEINEETEEIDLEWFIEINQFLYMVLSKIDDRTQAVIKEKFYILNDKNHIISLTELSDKQILYPRGFDNQFGWQLFFDPKKDCDSCEVLSEVYLNLKNVKQTELGDFLQLLEATDKPKTKCQIIKKWDDCHNEYSSHIFKSFTCRFTGGTNPKLYYYPNIKNFKEVVKKDKSRKAYFFWLDYFIGKDFFNPYIEYQYQWLRKYKISESSIVYEARETPCIGTQFGLKMPTEVFVDLDSTREILGDKVPYLQDDISKGLRNLLGIKESASISDLIQYLRDSSSHGNVVDLRVVTKVYNHLNVVTTSSEFQEIFANEALIYVPKQGWMTAGQTIWEDGET